MGRGGAEPRARQLEFGRARTWRRTCLAVEKKAMNPRLRQPRSQNCFWGVFLDPLKFAACSQPHLVRAHAIGRQPQAGIPSGIGWSLDGRDSRGCASRHHRNCHERRGSTREAPARGFSSLFQQRHAQHVVVLAVQEELSSEDPLDAEP